MIQSTSSRETKYQIMPELLLMVLESGEPIEVNSFFFSHDFMWSIDRCQLFRWIFSKFFLETMLTKIGETAKQKPRKLAPQREPMEF